SQNPTSYARPAPSPSLPAAAKPAPSSSHDPSPTHPAPPPPSTSSGTRQSVCASPANSLRLLLPRLPQTQSSAAAATSPRASREPAPPAPPIPFHCPRSPAPTCAPLRASHESPSPRETPCPGAPSPAQFPSRSSPSFPQSHSQSCRCELSAPHPPAVPSPPPLASLLGTTAQGSPQSRLFVINPCQVFSKPIQRSAYGRLLRKGNWGL